MTSFNDGIEAAARLVRDQMPLAAPDQKVILSGLAREIEALKRPEPSEGREDARLDLQYAAGMQAAAVRLAPFVSKEGTEALNEIGKLVDHRTIPAVEALKAAAPEPSEAEKVERVRRAVDEKLANLKGGCFLPEGKSERGECAERQCFCARFTDHVARAALAAMGRV